MAPPMTIKRDLLKSRTRSHDSCALDHPVVSIPLRVPLRTALSPSPSVLPLFTLPQPHWLSCYSCNVPGQLLPQHAASGHLASAPPPGHCTASVFMALRSCEVSPPQGGSHFSSHPSIPFVTSIPIRMEAP